MRQSYAKLQNEEKYLHLSISFILCYLISLFFSLSLSLYSFHCLVRFLGVVTSSGSSDGRLNFVILDSTNNLSSRKEGLKETCRNF